MALVPLDEGYPGRRRVGPFWIEEGPGLLAAGALIIAIFTVLFAIAVILRPT
jgi:hypothetical protein